MSYKRLAAAVAAGGAIAAAAPAFPAVVNHANQAAFQAALDGSFTLVNLDAAPLNLHAPGYRVEDPAPAADFAALGIDFFGVDARVEDGQDGQIATPGRDRLIFNGTGFDGEIRVNFVNAVNGIGALSNNIDGGRIRAFSGPDLGGDFLGEVQFGPGASFGGLTSSEELIRSALFTCDFNADLRCGVYDIQFGTFAADAPGTPEPTTLLLLMLGLLGIVASRRR
jgi:hypothetical protein